MFLKNALLLENSIYDNVTIFTAEELRNIATNSFNSYDEWQKSNNKKYIIDKFLWRELKNPESEYDNGLISQHAYSLVQSVEFKDPNNNRKVLIQFFF